MHSPRPLRSGDLVAVIAPSGPYNEDRLERGILALEERGYQVERLLPKAPWRYLAGGDDERLRLFHQAFSTPDVRAVFAARGGYGATRLLGKIDWDLVSAAGRPFIGFSDATALHLSLFGRGARSIHGPVVTRIAEEPPESRERLFSLLEDDSPPEPLRGQRVVRGEARGRVVGGCLSLVTSLLGTPYLPSLAGCILLLEEVGEAPYRIDRLLTQLLASGALDEIAGVALGSMTDCDTGDLQGEQVARELLADLGKPMIADLAVGHGDINLAIPHGAMAEIRDGGLHFLEGIW